MAGFVIGQKVAIYAAHSMGGTCWEATVERDTKLYWVAEGRKFRKSDGLESGSTSNWHLGTYLLLLDDPRVVKAKSKARKSRAYSRVMNAQDALRLDRESLHAIDTLRQALDVYADILSA